eukprot:CAMPEP_0119341198 /NCGR_PEP_ID=MMETSP1333-20130426/101847_1 /TAXON_ID=418940 /ORGANISM="Scyphosphaera apsteinii, Strain RCC1455" /LENGTH=62 /DNA_ID=CAMNT_0007353115 /DNA_START=874 /DNA_END=1061 /DNA_ORIENTATION=-
MAPAKKYELYRNKLKLKLTHQEFDSRACHWIEATSQRAVKGEDGKKARAKLNDEAANAQYHV